MDLAVEPLAVWDCGEPEWWQNRDLKWAWLLKHGLPSRLTYRVEFYLVDGPFARVFSYALDADGRPYFAPGHKPGEPHDHDSCRIAENEPATVPLAELPPAGLR